MGNCINTGRTTAHQPAMYAHSEEETHHQPLDTTHLVYQEYIDPVRAQLDSIERIRGRMHALTRARSGEPPFNTREFKDIRRAFINLLTDSRSVRHQARQITDELISGQRMPGTTNSGTPLQVVHSLSEFHHQTVQLGRRYNNEILRSAGVTAAALPAANSDAPEFFRQDSNVSEFGIPASFLMLEGR